jgi:hypothetical protein
MPIKKRLRIAPTEEWQQLELLVEDPEQRTYEVMRTFVLFGQSPAERARETGVPARSLYHLVERFDQLGMASLFVLTDETPRRGPSLSPTLRQLIVDRKAEYPAFHFDNHRPPRSSDRGRRFLPGMKTGSSCRGRWDVRPA